MHKSQPHDLRTNPDSMGVKCNIYLIACCSIIFVGFSILKPIVFIIQSDYIFVRFSPILFFGRREKSVKYNAENVDASGHNKNVTPSFASITRILVTLEKILIHSAIFPDFSCLWCYSGHFGTRF